MILFKNFDTLVSLLTKMKSNLHNEPGNDKLSESQEVTEADIQRALNSKMIDKAGWLRKPSQRIK